ncbi:L7Ae/L30e/S12e/Gadd45 family ribosomal protein [Candidatus Cloacimonadota bacterium]
MEKEIKPQVVSEKVLGLLHLARKAGALEFGFDACQRACMRGKVKLILTARDLSGRQKQSLKTLAEANNVKYREFGSKQMLGNAFNLRDVGVISVKDRNFASGIVSKLI